MKREAKEKGFGKPVRWSYFLISILSVLSIGIIAATSFDPVASVSSLVGGQFSSVALDSNGFVHISYYGIGPTLKYCNNTAGSWSCTNVTNTAGTTSIAIDSNNRAHIFTLNSSNSGVPRYCNNTEGSWSCVIIDAVLGDQTVFNSLALDTNNKAHVAYSNGVTHTIRYCNNTEGSWSCVETFTPSGSHSSLAIDTNNKAHIATGAYSSNRALYCNNTIGSWTCTYASGFYGGIDNSIALDSNNKAHISTYDNTNSALRYCNNTAGSWSCTLVESTGELGRDSSIAIGPNNKVFISHYDETNGAIRYCNNVAGSWACKQLSLFNQSASNPSPGGPFSTRALAIKKGRIVDSTSFSDYAHVTFYNSSGPTLTLFDITLDIVFPNLSIISPANNTNTTNTGLDITYTASDNVASSSCWYSNDTYTANTTITCGQNITTLTWSEGKHRLTIWTNDTENNINASTINFTIDNTPPAITLSGYTNGTAKKSSSSLTLNILVSDASTSAGTCIININGTNQTITSSSGWCNTTSGNLTGLSDGNRTINVYANDTLGNTALNSSYVVLIDSTPPTATLPVYANGTVKKNTNSLTLNISVSDATTSISRCIVNINGTNQTFTPSSGWCNTTSGNLTGLSDGNRSINVYANDSAGNYVLNNSFVVIIDGTNPTASITCTSTTVQTGAVFPCSCSGSDATAGINSSLTSGTSTSPDGTSTPQNTGTFTYSCSVTDNTGNTQSASIDYTVTEAGSSSGGSGGGGGGGSGGTSTPSVVVAKTVEPSQESTEVEISNRQIDLDNIRIDFKDLPLDMSLELTINVEQVSLEEDANFQVQVPDGNLYQGFSINIEGIDKENIENVTIDFKVNKTWLGEQNFSVDDISLYRKPTDSTQWNSLNTFYSSEDEDYYYFSSFSPGFSTFAIFASLKLCEPNSVRCFDSHLQTCSTDYRWNTKEECEFGCENSQCIGMRVDNSQIIIYALVASVSLGLVIGLYLMLKSLSKRPPAGMVKGSYSSKEKGIKKGK